MAQPFEQQLKESGKAFAAFTLYLNMGEQRSARAVANKLAKSEQLIRRWSARHCWVERVDAYAKHLAGCEHENKSALLREKSAQWLVRQEELKEREWAMHEKCIEAAELALANFMARENAYANLGDIARILEVASKIGRLASGMPTEKTEITGEEGGPIQIELMAALRKIYSQPLAEIVDAEVLAENS